MGTYRSLYQSNLVHQAEAGQRIAHPVFPRFRQRLYLAFSYTTA